MLLLRAVGLAASGVKFPADAKTRPTVFRVTAADLSEVGVAYRQRVLRQIDDELRRGNDRVVLSLARDLQGKPEGLRCFGAARQLPQRLYTLDELKLNGIDCSSLLSPVDSTLGSIERNFQVTTILGSLSAWYAFGFSQMQGLFFLLAFLFLGSCDLIVFNGGLWNLLLDTLGHTFSRKYHNRVVQHEAGHFLVAYLLGVLPKGYTISSLEAFKSQGSLNVQAGTAFVDFEFLEEVNKGSLTALMLNRFSCIALAGVVTEYLLFGYSEGGLADINQLDALLKSLGFTQAKANSQVRWAVLNTTLILRHHEHIRSLLAEAMDSGKSVGSCIDIVETSIAGSDI